MTQYQQYPLEFNFRPALEREDFLVSDTNASAVAMIDKWPAWHAPCVIIHGPRGSGKTHLCHVWQRISNAQILDLQSPSLMGDLIQRNTSSEHAYVIENLNQYDLENDQALQDHLFHFYNHIKATGQTLLITSEKPLNYLSISLADLRSRLLSCPHVAIEAPDDDLLSGLLLKLLRDQQIEITPDALHYCLKYMDRSFESAQKLVKDINYSTLSEKRRVTIPLIKKILNKGE